MEPLVKITGVVAPLDRMNVDTDQIIPKQFLKRIERTGFGEFLFFDWRYREDGSLNPDFELNQPHLKGTNILLAGQNFGSGSSREHAPWALREFGFRVIIAPSFADIFYNNCFKNGLLPIVLDAATVDRLFRECEASEGYRLAVDLAAQTVTTPGGETLAFEVDPGRKHRLLNGLDDIGLTLLHADKIKAYEDTRKVAAPWLFNA